MKSIFEDIPYDRVGAPVDVTTIQVRRLGSGSASVVTSPALWGGQIAPGSVFTLTLTHCTAQGPLLVTRYTTTWDLSSLLANADVISQSGTGTISGNSLSITSVGIKTDHSPKVIVFRVRQGTVCGSMTIRPTGIDNTAWGYYTGVYVVPPGQTVTRFAFSSVSAAGGGPAFGNFLDGVEFSTPPCPSAVGGGRIPGHARCALIDR